MEYKISTIEFIKKQASDWKILKFQEFASKEKNSFVNGPFGSDLLVAELVEYGIPIIYIRDIRENLYKRTSVACITQKKSERLKSFQVNKDDVILTKVGSPPCTAAVYCEDNIAIITQDVIRIRTSENVEPGYLSALINSDIGRRQIRSIAIEGTRERVSLTDLKRIKCTRSKGGVHRVSCQVPLFF
jgi:type I restriction enzyme S subunit